MGERGGLWLKRSGEENDDERRRGEGRQLAAGAAGTSSAGERAAFPDSAAEASPAAASAPSLAGDELVDSPAAWGAAVVSEGSTSIRSTSTMSTSGPRLGDEQPAIAPHETPITTPRAMRMMPRGACLERTGNREGHGMNRILEGRKNGGADG